MAGYSAPYIGLPDPEKRCVERKETPSTELSIAERRGKSWYKKLSLSIRGNGKSNRSSIIPESPTSPVKFKEGYLNKPLPPLPSPEQPPYFEYMFADAGIKKKKNKSTESLKSSVETDSNSQESTQSDTETRATDSNGSAQSYGLNGPEITQFAFAHAGVNVSTKEVIDNHFAALGTSLEATLDLGNLADELEREKATEDFFGGIQVKEAPTADHVPVVDEEGFVDRREGLEDWPQLWRHDKEIPATSTVAEPENFAVQHSKSPMEHDISGAKHILQPKSQKNKVRLQDPPFSGRYQTVTTNITALAVQSVQSPVRAPRPLTIRKKNKSPRHNHISKKYRANKRSARDSFVTKSTLNHPKSDDDYNINLLPTKKIRVTETVVDQDINSPSRAVSVCGSISSPSSVDLTSPNTATSSNVDINTNNTDTDITDADDDEEDTASLLSLKHKRLTTSLTGYPGQFESYEAEYLSVRATLAAPELFTTGDAGHPNGLFTHTNFVGDPTFPAREYTPAMLAALPVRDLALKHAETATQSYACSHRVSALRTPTQEMLRREIHRECAAARLEGVSAGEYRYYQGFMSLEEYLAARVCVCWGFCWCSKLCGRYADVLCPCSEWIAVHGDDD